MLHVTQNITKMKN